MSEELETNNNMTHNMETYIELHKMPREGDYIELCITFQDHEQYFNLYDPFNRKRQCVFYFMKLLSEAFPFTLCKDYLFRPEISFKGCRFHVHAIIQVGVDPVACMMGLNYLRYHDPEVSSKSKKLKTAQERIVEMYRINGKEHLEERVKYICKDQNQWAEQICVINDRLKELPDSPLEKLSQFKKKLKKK